MLYQDNSTNQADREQSVIQEYLSEDYQTEFSNFNVQQEIEKIANTLLEGVSVPLTDLIVVDGGVILDHLEAIKDNLPTTLAASIEIVKQRQAILQQANNQAQSIIKKAQRESEEILNNSALRRQAELEASKIKFETERECTQMRQATQQEIEQWRKDASQEYESIQQDADRYAQTVLNDLQTQLTQMLSVVENGRQYIESEPENY